MNVVLNESTVVKEFDFNTPDIHDIDCLVHYYFKDCRNKYFHSFEYTLVYDIKFTNISNNDEINFTNTHRSMPFKSGFFGLNKKNQKSSKKWFCI